jgi:hypothetical protein
MYRHACWEAGTLVNFESKFRKTVFSSYDTCFVSLRFAAQAGRGGRCELNQSVRVRENSEKPAKIKRSVR